MPISAPSDVGNADLLPNTDNTFDIGSASFRWNNLFLGADLVMKSAGIVGLIRQDTTDGADNKRLALASGGDADATRGGYIYLYGNENNSGIVEVSAGSVSGSKVQIIAANGSANARIEFNLNVNAWRMDEALNRDLIAIGGASTRRIRSDANTSLLEFRGGSGTDNTTGGALSTYGNSHGTFPGRTLLETGAVAAAPLILQTSGTGSILYNTNSTTKRTFTSDGLDTLKSHAAYTGSGASQQTAVVNTTNATTTSLFSLSLADNTTYKFTADVIGRFNSATDKGVWTKLDFGVYRNNAGGATLIGSIVSLNDTYGTSGYAVTADVSGNDVRIRVTGAAGETVSWEGDIKYTAVSTAA